MSLGMMRTLGYDDDYRSTKDSRDIYNLTWNAFDCQLGKYLNPTTQAVSISTPLAHLGMVVNACELTKVAIKKAERSSARKMQQKRK